MPLRKRKEQAERLGKEKKDFFDQNSPDATGFPGAPRTADDTAAAHIDGFVVEECNDEV